MLTLKINKLFGTCVPTLPMYSSSNLLFELMLINIINLFSARASDFSYGFFLQFF
jgi:hypothetical protein